MDRISITKPDDCHLHLRSGSILKTVIGHSSRQFARAIIMPNLKPPVTNMLQALAYRQEILSAVPEQVNFQPLMTLYLCSNTSIEDVKEVANSDLVLGFKLYPSGATTNSEFGIAEIQSVFPVFAAMEKYQVPLLIHAEVSDARHDIFDREKIFIDSSLSLIIQQFPELRIVVEHLTTAEAVQFVESTGKNIAATLTPQHLLFNRNAMLAGGIRPHFYCLPILKREHHRIALVQAAISGNPKFFLGTDSAPHLSHLKENHCGCAGCYSAHAALELYTGLFEQMNALDKLEGFAAFYGADFYGLPRNIEKISLQKQTWQVPEKYGAGETMITPLLAGENLTWQVVIP